MGQADTQTLGYHDLKTHSRYCWTGKVLGSGAFGTVVEAWGCDKSGQINKAEKYAIKLLKRGDAITETVETEVVQHYKLSHPQVVKLKDVVLTQHHLGIVLELVKGGDLFEYVSKHPRGCTESQARRIFQQLILGLDYIHSAGICQRDIKLDNILVVNKWSEKPDIKITDFGYCKGSEQSAPHSCVGTCAYMAPEVFRIAEDRTRRYCGKKADIWSCGVLLYVLLYVRYPFELSDDPSDRCDANKLAIKRLLKGEIEYPEKSNVSPACLDLLRRLLRLDPAKRLDAADTLRHPWVMQDMPPQAIPNNATYIKQYRKTEMRETDRGRFYANIRNTVRLAKHVL